MKVMDGVSRVYRIVSQKLFALFRFAMIHAMDSLAKKQLEFLQNRQIALTEALL